jgi:DNA anti-recombination protein RmuC
MYAIEGVSMVAISPEMREFLKREKEIDEKMEQAGNDYDQMLKILNEKYALYRKYENLITEKEEHFVLLDKVRDIRIYATIYKAASDFQKDIARLTSRLDVLEKSK